MARSLEATTTVVGWPCATPRALRVADPEPDGMGQAAQVRGQGRAPRPAADDGDVHEAPAARPPRRRSVPAAIRRRFPRCFQTMSAATSVAAHASADGSRSQKAARARALAPAMEPTDA